MKGISEPLQVEEQLPELRTADSITRRYVPAMIAGG